MCIRDRTDTTRPHVRRSENWFSDSQSRVTGAGGFSQGEWYIQAGVEHDLSVSYDNDGSGSIKLDAPYVFPLTGNMQARLQRNPDPGQSFVVGFHMLSDVDLAGVNIWAIFTGTDCDQEEATGTVKALSRKTRAAGREAGVWHEVVVKFVAPRDPRCFEQATKIKLLRLDADYQVPKDGDVWIDNLYAGTFGTVEPPAAKRSFDGGTCLLYTSPSPRDVEESRMPSSA